MVKLNKIYTRTGDDGTTALVSGPRRDKHDIRVEAYGTVDEVNSTIGMARLHTAGMGEVDQMLFRIQNDLFDLGADLATPDTGEKPEYEPLRIVEAQATRLETEIDTLNADLEPLKSFVLPGGSPASAYLHLARTVSRRAERLMVELRVVTDSMAHDLRSPLTRLRNQAESALREGASDQSRQQALETTIAESDRLIQTFNALLMIARAEAGAPSGALSDIDVSAIVADVAELYGPVAEDEGIIIETAIVESVHLHANRELIGQAMVNLLENAVKYAKPLGEGQGQITVGLRRADGRVLIEVADNGPGIAEADRKRVIERFVRLEKSRSEAGSGLGLSLVSAVARLHGGSFRIEDNAPGVRAVIDLPAI